MVTRITAEFDSPDIAEKAVHSIYRNVRGVYSANLMKRHTHDRKSVTEGTVSALEGSAGTFTDISSDAPLQSAGAKSSIFVVCDGSNVDEIRSLLSSLGGSSIDP